MAMTEFELAQPFVGTVEDMYTLLRTMLFVTATTAELDAIANAINTDRKFVGKLVFNTTSGLLVMADAATAAGTWSSASDGLVDHTPA